MARAARSGRRYESSEASSRAAMTRCRASRHGARRATRDAAPARPASAWPAGAAAARGAALAVLRKRSSSALHAVGHDGAAARSPRARAQQRPPDEARERRAREMAEFIAMSPAGGDARDEPESGGRRVIHDAGHIARVARRVSRRRRARGSPSRAPTRPRTAAVHEARFARRRARRRARAGRARSRRGARGAARAPPRPSGRRLAIELRDHVEDPGRVCRCPAA